MTTAPSSLTTAMIILNSPISNPPSPIFERLWRASDYHICADGGANRLMDATRDNDYFVPNAIRGDLDSLREDTRAYFESKGVEIEKNPDQNSNDLDKAMHKILKVPKDFDQIIIYGAFGGRFDQEMANFQNLYKWAPNFQHRVWLYSDETSACLVPPNQIVEIQVPHTENSSIREGPTCGIIPLGCECTSLSITGFKWNVKETKSAFGGLVSTSNHILDDIATVEASHPIIFTVEVVCRNDASNR